MKASKLIALSLLAATPAFAQVIETPYYTAEVVGYTGPCGELPPELQEPASDTSALDFVFGDLAVEANETETQVRKLCNVKVRVQVKPGYKLGVDDVFYEGFTDIDDFGGSGNVSARAFFTGARSLHGFRRFSAGEAGNFEVTLAEGQPQLTGCGATTTLNLLVDITARTQPHNGSYSQVAIQRGVATPTPVDDAPVIQCGIKVQRCGN
jgi:hypothetical protein